MQTRDAETVGKAGDVSRLDGLCYDNTKSQVESWRGERLAKAGDVSRLDGLCYDNTGCPKVP